MIDVTIAVHRCNVEIIEANYFLSFPHRSTRVVLFHILQYMYICSIIEPYYWIKRDYIEKNDSYFQMRLSEKEKRKSLFYFRYIFFHTRIKFSTTLHSRAFYATL